MSSLDELILFNSAFWREEGMLDGTKYAYMKKLDEHCRRAAGGNFPAGYYEPESMPYMLALRDACHPSGPLAGAGTRRCAASAALVPGIHRAQRLARSTPAGATADGFVWKRPTTHEQGRAPDCDGAV